MYIQQNSYIYIQHSCSEVTTTYVLTCTLTLISHPLIYLWSIQHNHSQTDIYKTMYVRIYMRLKCTTCTVHTLCIVLMYYSRYIQQYYYLYCTYYVHVWWFWWYIHTSVSHHLVWLAHYSGAIDNAGKTHYKSNERGTQQHWVVLSLTLHKLLTVVLHVVVQTYKWKIRADYD